MSWAEVKKINSDMSVPLDERMQYVAGIIPRNMTSKTFTCAKESVTSISSSFPVEADIVLSEITGRGYLYGAQISIETDLPNNTSWQYYGNGYADLEMILDETNVITLCSDKIEGRSSTLSKSISYNANSLSGIPRDVKTFNSSATINEPYSFEKSAKFIMKFRNPKWENTSGANNRLKATATVNVLI